ncbi:MAG: hypothetical protein ACR2IV_20715 [Bryobacteraceae bacterium]
MTKLHHKGSAKLPPTLDADALLATVEAFLTTCRNPAMIEYGEEITRLAPGQYALELRAGRVWIEVWCETRSISRRILAIERHAIGMLDCTVQRFGGKSGKFSFLDLDRPQSAHRTLRGNRQSFTEQFRRTLSRQFPGWEICTLSCGMDLQRSFSPVFPRARLERGNQQIAALACADVSDESAMLTFALIWHQHVSARGAQGIHTSLCLFLPDTAGCLTAHRLRWLTGKTLETRLFRFNAHGSAGEVDARDLGNIQTRVSPHYVQASLNVDLSALLARLSAISGFGYCPELNGGISMRCRGLEFARIENGRLMLGIETKREVSASHNQDVEQLAAQIATSGPSSVSASAACMHRSGLQTFPERWLESSVRSSLSTIDASLLQSPVHGQVLTFAAGDRDLIDLLAVSFSGRLAVLELKASEDIHLPLQALDYWMRIAWHAQSGELEHLFPGISLEGRSPRLLLVAPAICFHPSNATVLRYFSPDIEVERIGINSEWSENLRVVLRLKGAEAPISHRSSQ